MKTTRKTPQPNLPPELAWLRLTGLLRREVQLFEKLLRLLLHQREAVVLANVAAYQTIVLEQIHLLQELDQVQTELIEERARVARAHELPEDVTISALAAVAPEEFQPELKRLASKVRTLAEESAQLNARNRRLLELLGEIRMSQFDVMVRAGKEDPVYRSFEATRRATDPTLWEAVA